MARILVAYDGSEGARRALARVPNLAREGDIVAVLGVEPPIHGGAASAADVAGSADSVADMRSALDEAIEELAGQGVKAQILQLNGHVADEILDAAEAGNFDIVVIGSRNGRGLRRMVLGSISTKVAHDAPCDVYLVH